MCKAYRHILVGLLISAGISAPAQVPTNLDTSGPILLPSTSSSYNQQGFNLPSAPRASGQDIVRGAGGVSCQSAVARGGPVLDMGVIGTNDIFDRDSAALYGRLTIPLGRKTKRVDCTRLYELEMQRLKMELEMLRYGLASNAAPPPVIEDTQSEEELVVDATPTRPFILGQIGKTPDDPPTP